MTTKDNAEVYKVVNPVRGLPHVLPGDHLIVWEEGEVSLQRMVDTETFTTLGTADALEFLPQRHQLNETLKTATETLREAVNELTETDAGG